MTVADSSTLGPPSIQDGGAELFAWLRRMRDEKPVWRDPGGRFHVFRYDEVQRVLSDTGSFSSDRSSMMPNSDLLASGNLTMMDPPRHRQLRGLINQAFTPKIIAGLAPRVTEIASGLLDAVPGDEFDLMERLAFPLPVIVIAELLGVPPADHDLYRTWATGFGDAMESSVREMNDYMLQRCAERRRSPKPDLISQLVAAEPDGQRLSDDEIAELCSLLLLAGYITTTMMLGNAVISLDERPETARALRADPARIPDAIEEVLRYRAPFMQVGRIATADVVIGGVAIPKGGYVNGWLLSANHDERRFPDPERFDITRASAAGQLAFGHGIHFCLGTPLARMEGRIAIALLQQRFSEFRVTPGAEVPYIEGVIFGVKRLPITVRRRNT
jgi:cytochrome P450